ncbi:cytochrome c biogenesis protein CcdA [Pseudalkalibacillus caeni]|uniref:Cytochrome c biogenesis protein CcdA n=1 Tax=Exobacillus caeni TaxID=2574798 RepID=A0A5R9F7U8_9BACL|nr:cytochrome c biogenesis protein CcdA [Pseudalkalibacillus caeni]
MSIWFAFAAGLLSFFSPCIFPLIPAYVANLTGASFAGGKMEVNRSTLMVRAISFIFGFSLIFVVMGASASFLGQFFANYRELVEKISGFLIVVFGLQMAGFISIKLLNQGKQWKTNNQKPKGTLRSFVVGLAFGTGWTPCVGLALSSILLLAGSSDTVYNGVLMLAVYSIGLGVPFLVLAYLITYSLKITKQLNRFMPVISKVSGYLFIIMGILLFTGTMQKISAWLAILSY